MRAAWALYGLGFVILVVGAAYAFNHKFSATGDTQSITSPSANTMQGTLSLTSTAFENNGAIPSKYTCDGERATNPPLSISGVPEDTRSLVLIMEDPDVPKALKSDGVFDHWTLFNIPPNTAEIPEGGTAGIAGKNGAGQNQYTGPCPPREYEPSEHRYFFKLYALDTELSLQAGASKADVERVMQGHIIAQTELVGRYKRP